MFCRCQAVCLWNLCSSIQRPETPDPTQQVTYRWVMQSLIFARLYLSFSSIQFMFISIQFMLNQFNLCWINSIYVYFKSICVYFNSIYVLFQFILCLISIQSMFISIQFMFISIQFMLIMKCNFVVTAVFLLLQGRSLFSAVNVIDRLWTRIDCGATLMPCMRIVVLMRVTIPVVLSGPHMLMVSKNTRSHIYHRMY